MTESQRRGSLPGSLAIDPKSTAFLYVHAVRVLQTTLSYDQSRHHPSMCPTRQMLMMEHGLIHCSARYPSNARGDSRAGRCRVLLRVARCGESCRDHPGQKHFFFSRGGESLHESNVGHVKERRQALPCSNQTVEGRAFRAFCLLLSSSAVHRLTT